MNQENIIRMAREAQLGTSLTHKGGEQRVWIEGADWHDELERFANLVAAAEREACAKICDHIKNDIYNNSQEDTQPMAHAVANFCAAAIRARGDQEQLR